jgi:squalene-hopene/tetraprenyl-beta-curcumene cyclase
MLREYLSHGVETQTPFNRTMLLWASSKLQGLLTSEQRQAIIDAAVAKQHADGGWSLSDLGSYKRSDSTALVTSSDGLATGLITLALQSVGVPKSNAHVAKGLEWLSHNQDRTTGMWSAESLNKERDLKTDIGKFMSDAATAYAVLALIQN